MRHERVTETVRQQAALYVLGLLTQHEANCFDRHIEECPICREEFSRLLLAVAQIGLAINEEEPPENFRERLVDRIDASPPFGLLFNSQPSEEPDQKDEPDGEKIPNDKEVPEQRFPHPQDKAFFSFSTDPYSFTSRPRSGKTAIIIHTIMYILLVAIASFAFYTLYFSEKTNLQLQDRLEESELELVDFADLRRQFELRTADVMELEKYMDLFRKPYTRIARLKGQPSTPDNTGVVFWNSITGDVTVVGAFAPADAGKTYHLWFSTSSGRISAGQLPSDVNGYISAVLELNHDTVSAQAVTALVTLESEIDSPSRVAPEGPWIATGRIE